MNWHTLIVNIFDNLSMVLGRTLEGLSQEDLNHQPTRDSNREGGETQGGERGQRQGKRTPQPRERMGPRQALLISEQQLPPRQQTQLRGIAQKRGSR